jgi:NADH:ubiquinone oxidoreductase subunit 5 (subunit L)/multisubunit Na+/H+ antiporter MnhA subunit
VFLTFFGRPSRQAQKAHESGASMLVPLVVLAVGSLGVGYFAADFAGLYREQYHGFHVGFSGLVATVLGLSGIFLSWLMYNRRTVTESAFEFLAPFRELAHSAALDESYERFYRRFLLGFARAVAWFDRYIIDGVMNWIGYATIDTGRTIRLWQSGNVRDYVLAVVGGVVALATWGLMP